MTMIEGVRIRATPCCGKLYASPNYVSLNFMSFGFWTDGWRERSLMPNETGLRQCACGIFVKLKDMIDVRIDAKSDLPRMEHIPGQLLQDCIKQAKDTDMEILARIAYWRFANHEYRDKYRAHRDAEEEESKKIWNVLQNQTNKWWKKLLRIPPPEYRRSSNSPFTYPPFEPTIAQVENMTILSDMLLEIQKKEPGRYVTTLAELYRELGRFEEAKAQILSIPENEIGTTSKLLSDLIDEKETALIRYRM
jgi:hypothetical protein